MSDDRRSGLPDRRLLRTDRRTNLPERRRERREATSWERRKKHPYDKLGDECGRCQFIIRVAVALVVGLFLSWASSWLLPGGEAAKRVLAGTYLPWLTASDHSPVSGLLPPLVTEYGNYPATGQRQVTVITFDDADLEALRIKWPPNLGVYARLVDRLTPVRPRAIFLDFLLLDPRPDPEVIALRDAACRAARAGIPVFLASIPGERKDGSPETLLREPQDLGEKAGPRPCIHLASPFTSEDRFDRSSWEYPLCGGGLPSAALALACTAPTADFATQPGPALCQWSKERHSCTAGTELPALAMVWPAKGSEHNRSLLLRRADAPSDDMQARRLRVPGYQSSCRTEVLKRQYLLPLTFFLPQDGVPDWALALLPVSLAAVLSDDDAASKTLCPYTDILPMRALSGYGLKPEQLPPLIEGRALLIGANFVGQTDRHSAPLHREVAGVQVHAMALDNLLTYGDSWRQAGDVKFEWPVPRATAFAVFSVLMIVLGWELQQWLGDRARKHEKPRKAPWTDWAFWRIGSLPTPPAQPSRAAVAGNWLTGVKNIVLAAGSLGQLPARRRGRLPGLSLVGFIVLTLALWSLLIGLLFVAANELFHVGPLSQVEYVLAPLVLGFIDQGHRLTRGTVLLWKAAQEPRPAQFVRDHRKVQRDEVWAHKRDIADAPPDDPRRPAAPGAAAPPDPAPSRRRTRS